MKKKQDEERQEDLTSATDEELEARVHKMLDPSLPDEEEEEKPEDASTPAVKQSKKIAVMHDQNATEPVPEEKQSEKSPEPTQASEDEVPSAPLVTESEDTKEDAKPEKSDAEKPTELKKAIEETNEKLASRVIPVSDESAPEEVAVELGKVAADEVVEAPAPEPGAASKEAGEALPDAYNDDATEKAVDDITASESDELLAAQDEKQEALKQSEPKQSSGFGAAIRGILRSRVFRWALFLLVLGAVGGAAAMPTTRYYALNATGVRSGASVQVVDQSSFQPLKDVKVQLGDQIAMTDSDGNARFSGLKLGTTSLSIQKRAFTTVNETVTLGWGSNPLGNRNISPAGSQYTFTVTDFLSGKPIAKAAATSGEADAQSDDKGQIKLTLEHSDTANAEVVITANGYREEKINLELAAKQTIQLKMVPARKEVFVSKRSGTFDVYKVDVDGKNETLVLKGTGNERDDLALVPHPMEELVALVSTRDGKRNKDGYLLSTLTLINLKDGTTKSVTQSEQIQIANWIGDRLVYVQIAAGASASDPNRQRLMSYDYRIADNRQIASSNYFNDVLTVNGKVYYAPSSTFQPAGATVGLFRVNADGSSKQTVLPQEAWNVFRTAYDKIVISIPGTWYEFKVDSNVPAKLDGQPSNITSRVYVDSPDGKQSIWVDNRDGKGVVLLYDIGTKSEKTLRTQSGLKNPIRWLNDRVIVYRIHIDQETADYALSLDGGEPHKIRDVTNTGGIDKWYYYN